MSAKLLGLIFVGILGQHLTSALEACPKNCVDSECSSLGCVKCESGFNLFPDPDTGKSICREKCPEGYYTNPVNWCETCNTSTPHCVTCSDEYTCTGCETGYDVQEDGTCLFTFYRV